MILLALLKGLDFAAKAMQYAHKAIEAGKDAVVVGEFLKKKMEAVEKMKAEERGPTDEEWAELNAEIDAQHDQIQKS